MNIIKLLKIDPFLLTLVIVVATATFLPCEGRINTFFESLTSLAIALLFFMHGAKLSFNAIIDGIKNWKLHLMIFITTFAFFPLLGVGLQIFVPALLTHNLYLGFIYLCTLPATVQSAIAFTSIARGNVAAAICSASASTLLGVFITPILIGLFMHAQSDNAMDISEAVISIMLKLMLPFILGHLSRPLIGLWIDKYRKIINQTDRLSILLVVYVAFSNAVINGIWQQIDIISFITIIIFSLILLTSVLVITRYGSRLLGFNKQDEITIVFCGSKKSLASGIPMASIIFPAAVTGMMVLPLMIFHQIQLMVCAILAAHYAKRQD